MVVQQGPTGLTGVTRGDGQATVAGICRGAGLVRGLDRGIVGPRRTTRASCGAWVTVVGWATV